jgi:tetratricopeptide (TPR) repeat protein
MDAADLQALLRDANVLAQYAARNGKLPPQSKAFELIAALEAHPAPADAPALVVQLYGEIDLLAKAIAPMTLKRLMRRGSFVGEARRAVAVITPFAVGLLTLLLTFYLAFQSSQLNQADTALREYQEWVAQQPKEKLYAAFKMYRYEHVLNVSEPPLAQLDAYQKLVEDAHQLADKGAAIQQLLQHASNYLYFPHILEEVGPKFLQSFVRRLNLGEVRQETVGNLPQQPGTTFVVTEPPLPDNSPGAPGPQPPAGGTGVSALQLPGYNVGGPVPQRLDCKVEASKPPQKKAARTTPLRPAVEIEAYVDSWECFLGRLQISEERLSYSPWPVIYDTKLKVNLLVTWLLPGLYGLLGACVYLMRDLVLLRDSHFNRDTSILTELSLVLRIALGGLAGIIIGWFWVPAPIGNGTAAPAISSIPFGIAFLAGFSIDTLFSLLDRLNKTIGNRDAPKPNNAG